MTDDTVAIQQALDAASYVYFPDGIYMINGNSTNWWSAINGGIFPHSNQTIILSNNATLKVIENLSGFYTILNIIITINPSINPFFHSIIWIR